MQPDLEAERKALADERAAFEAQANARAQELQDEDVKLARERERLERLEADLARDDDRSEGRAAVDPEAKRTEELREALRRAQGAGGIGVTVARMVDGEWETLAAPKIQLADADIEVYQEKIAAVHGGGRFKAQFRAPGGTFLGAPVEFKVAGPPRGPGLALVETTAGPSAREAELLAKLAAVEAEKAKAQEGAAIDARLAAALAPVLAKLEAQERRAPDPVVKPEPSALEALMIDQIKKKAAADLVGHGAVSPELLAMKASLEQTTKALEELKAESQAQKQRAAEREQQRKDEKLEARLDALQASITAGAAKKEDPDAQLDEIMMRAKKFDLWANAGKKEGDPRTPHFERFLERMGDKLAGPFMGILENKATQVAESMTGKPGDAKATPGTGGGDKKPDDAKAYATWLTDEFKKNFAVARDKKAVGSALGRFPNLLANLLAVKDRAALIEHLVEHVGFSREAVNQVCDDGAWSRLEPRLVELRETVRTIVAEVDAKEAAEKKKAKAEKAKAEAETETEDEDEDQGDEDDDGEASGGDEDGDEEDDAEEGEEEGDGEAPGEAPGAPENGAAPGPWAQEPTRGAPRGGEPE